MISRIGVYRPTFVRQLCRLSVLSNKAISPEEYLQKRQQENTENEEFTLTLASGAFNYQPKIIPNNLGYGSNKKPVPINEELLKYKPLRLPKTHGNEVVNVHLRGYNQEDLILAGEFASRAAYYLGIPMSGLIKEKTEKRLYTVIRSPFAQAKSKENFHRTTFNFRLKAFDANAEIIDLWLSYVNKNALEGVSYKAKITTSESVDFATEFDNIDVENIQIPQSFKADDPVMKKVDEILASESFNNSE